MRVQRVQNGAAPQFAPKLHRHNKLTCSGLRESTIKRDLRGWMSSKISFQALLDPLTCVQFKATAHTLIMLEPPDIIIPE